MPVNTPLEIELGTFLCFLMMFKRITCLVGNKWLIIDFHKFIHIRYVYRTFAMLSICSLVSSDVTFGRVCYSTGTHCNMILQGMLLRPMQPSWRHWTWSPCRCATQTSFTANWLQKLLKNIWNSPFGMGLLWGRCAVAWNWAHRRSRRGKTRIRATTRSTLWPLASFPPTAAGVLVRLLCADIIFWCVWKCRGTAAFRKYYVHANLVFLFPFSLHAWWLHVCLYVLYYTCSI